MANISYTASNVVATDASTVKASGISGGAINIGEAVYLDPADGLIKKAQANVGSPTHAPNIVGVALDTVAGTNQPITYATKGDVTFGSGLTQAQVYVVSATAAGAIAPYVDLVSGNYVGFLGVALNTSVLRLGLIPTSTPK
jgi:hypothetical protein